MKSIEQHTWPNFQKIYYSFRKRLMLHRSWDTFYFLSPFHHQEKHHFWTEEKLLSQQFPIYDRPSSISLKLNSNFLQQSLYQHSIRSFCCQLLMALLIHTNKFCLTGKYFRRRWDLCRIIVPIHHDLAEFNFPNGVSPFCSPRLIEIYRGAMRPISSVSPHFGVVNAS